MKNQLKNKKMSRKLLVPILIFFATATSQLHSQQYDTYLYESDFRIGITAGGGINLQRGVLLWPDTNCKLTETREGFKEKLGLSYGIFVGHEKALKNERLRWGFDVATLYSREKWTTEFENDTNGNITTITNVLTNLVLDEGFYLSYLINDRLAVNAGINFYETLLLPIVTTFATVDRNGSSVEESPLYSELELLDPEGKDNLSDIFKIGIKIGARLRIGATYNINELLFISANAYYSLPFYFSFSKEYIHFEGDIYGLGHLGVVGKYKNFVQNAGLMISFGFKL